MNTCRVVSAASCTWDTTPGAAVARSGHVVILTAGRETSLKRRRSRLVLSGASGVRVTGALCHNFSASSRRSCGHLGRKSWQVQ